MTHRVIASEETHLAGGISLETAPTEGIDMVRWTDTPDGGTRVTGAIHDIARRSDYRSVGRALIRLGVALCECADRGRHDA